jgi:sugar phosphate isomerase/epimerase
MEPKKHKLGIAVSWFDQQLLTDIKAAGFDLIMPFICDDFEKIIKGAKDLGLGFPIAHLDSKGNIEQDILRASAVGGIEILVLHPRGLQKSQLEKYIILAQKHNMRIALENIRAQDDQTLGELLDEFQADTLGFCYDCAHHHIFNPTEDLLGKYGARCIAVHLSDGLLDYDDHILPFDGRLDFEKIMNDLKNIQGAIFILEAFQHPLGNEHNLYDNWTQTEFICEAAARIKKLCAMLNS